VTASDVVIRPYRDSDYAAVCAVHDRARRLYESEGFTIVRTYQGSNPGYSCTCVQLALQAKR